MLGGVLKWRVHKFGAWVACVQISEAGPYLLLADHLQQKKPVLIYRVDNIQKAAHELRSRGWLQADGPFEIPNGPCYTFQDPIGMRLAIYENLRPDVFFEESDVPVADETEPEK